MSIVGKIRPGQGYEAAGGRPRRRGGALLSGHGNPNKGVPYFLMLVGAVFFFLAARDLHRAREAEQWPARAVRITVSELVTDPGDEDRGPSLSLRLGGMFLDTKEEFDHTQIGFGILWSDAVVKAYHARYPVGLVTNVYYDPSHPDRVILDNHPSLRGVQVVRVVMAIVFLIGLALRVFWKRLPASVVNPRGARRVELSPRAERVVGWLLGAVALGLGTWITYMGVVCRTPAGAIPEGEIGGFVAMGLMWVVGGAVVLVGVGIGRRAPRWVSGALLGTFMVCLATLFLYSGIFLGDQIRSSVGIDDDVVIERKGGWGGRIAFIGVGLLILGWTPFVVRSAVRRD